MKKFIKYIILVILISTVSLVSLILFREISYIPALKEESININFDRPLFDDYFKRLIKKYLIKGIKYDENSIPIFEINKQYYYHPVYISQFAIGAYEYYLITDNIKAKEHFLQCADWLKDNLRKHGKFFYWEYNFEIDYPGIERIPWFSAMAQGEGTSVLLRAYYETKNKKYLDAATKAIEPILYDISQGGISVIRGESYIFPQEISTNPPSDILNGAIIAYIGLYEYYRITDDRNVKKFCDIVVKTFSDVLEQFDTGYWSLYSRWPKYLADPHYNSVHVSQLKFLYLMTGNKKFLVYSRRFQDYQNNWINRVKYVFSNHVRQAQELSFKDINKIPSFLKQYL